MTLCSVHCATWIYAYLPYLLSNVWWKSLQIPQWCEILCVDFLRHARFHSYKLHPGFYMRNSGGFPWGGGSEIHDKRLTNGVDWKLHTADGIAEISTVCHTLPLSWANVSLTFASDVNKDWRQGPRTWVSRPRTCRLCDSYKIFVTNYTRYLKTRRKVQTM